MKTDPTRVSARGYWRFARDYFRAAESVVGSHQDLMFPALYLCGHSIELALKAFLLGRGETHEAVEKYKHHLDRLVTHLAAIRVLAETYSRYPHLLRYFVRGVTRVPTPSSALATTERLIRGLEPFCTGMVGRV